MYDPYGLSIIIPVKGQLPLMESLLNSIANSDNSCWMGRLEVVAVWDGNSSPEQALKAFEYRTRIPARAIFLQAGPAEKRNRGIKASHYEILLFVDSDCILHPGLLRAISDRFLDSEVLAAAPPIQFESPQTPLEQAQKTMPYRQAYDWGGFSEPQWWTPSATLILRRSAVEKLGGFWTAPGGVPRGEDVDLGLRWTTAIGKPAVTTLPAQPTQHTRETWSSTVQMLRRAWWFGWSESDLCLRHPHFKRWTTPSFLPIALVVGSAGSFLILAGFRPAVGLLLFAATMLIGWFMEEWIIFSRRGRLRPAETLMGLPLAALYEMGRTVSSWWHRIPAHGLWFHEHQAKFSWAGEVHHAFLFWFLGTVGAVAAILLTK